MSNKLNVQRVQLPDGTLVRIEGGNSRDTARFLANRLGAHVTESGDSPEQPLEAPTTHTTNPPAQPSTVPVWLSQAGSGFVANGEEPLELPQMKF